MRFGERKAWRDQWRQLRTALLKPSVDERDLAASLAAARAKLPIPVLWLIGKTQAGKTSIIRALTGSDRAEIGSGFQPCTRHARLYDFPAEMPVVRFLDTRGLGEITYDPDEDIRFAEAQAHLLLAVMKVADQRQEAVFDVLRAVRRRHPEWPVLIAQTGLHELYAPVSDHPVPYPFASEPWPDRVPADLRRALIAQRRALPALSGSAPVSWVAIDLTQPDDGYEPADYGLEALWQGIEQVSPLGLKTQLLGDDGVRDLYARTAHLQIVGHALAAAGIGAVPIVDLVGVAAVQAKLLHALGALYRQTWDRRTTAQFLGLLGAGVATGLLAHWFGRSAIKLIPVWGQTVGAVVGAGSGGATTYALGKAAVYFLARRQDGLEVDPTRLRQVYAEALARGARVIQDRARANQR
ncbi:GTPase [Thioalkalicoccus limnaeus]|uniref:GTPase n=1 Tax=Thioalkalicoccus limnaeus TaxID=120681 RepID=A0ABV4BBK2_9GAMM